ncbi:MAG: hypothetical protein GXP26_10635 [Planctomycetes bacterium]|nr:hypothetical protein [Planctomycetota bacterium]
MIDISELERVYPLVKTMDEIKQVSGTASARPGASESDVSSELAVTRQKLASSEAMREVLATERERERRQLESEIENLRSSLEKSQDQHNKALLLITDQSKQQAKERGGDWEVAARKLREKIANQETLFKKRFHSLRQEAKRDAIAELKAKPWWQVMFG